MTAQAEQTIDEILLIPADDWTPEQTERVKKAVKNGEVIMIRPMLPSPPIPFDPIYPTPPTTPLIPGMGSPPWRQWYTTTDRTSDDCSIRRYFRDNPDKTYVHMVCNCRLCTIQC